MRRSLVVLLLAAACTTSPDPLPGTYTLRTVNGGALPYVSPSGTATRSLTSATLTVTGDGGWSESMTFTQSEPGLASFTRTELDAGQWSRHGGTLVFDSILMGHVGFTGTYQSGALALDDGAGAAHIFAR